MLIQQARNDALNMDKASRMQGLKTHARKISAGFNSNNADSEGLLHQQQANTMQPRLAELE